MTADEANRAFHEGVTTTPLSPDQEAETAVEEERPSIASLLLPPVGSVDPDGWKSPVARTSKRTYVPPEFDAETRAALQAKVVEEERQSVEEERRAAEAAAVQARLDAEALAEAEKHASRKRLKKPSVKVPAVKVAPVRKPRPEMSEPDEAVEPAEGAVMDEAPADDWTSAAPAIEHIHKQFFARPEELRPAPVEDMVLESGPDLQLRIYMREVLEPWWTGELGSTTALKRLVALRASLDEDSP
jgi:hypothetical protein